MDTSTVDGVRLHVGVSEPAMVTVDYWTDDQHHWRQRLTEPAPFGDLLLPGLQGGKVYQYEVTAVDDNGQTSAIVRGALSTSALPAVLAKVQIATTGASSSPLTMLEINAEYKGFVAVDGAGHPLWRWATRGAPQGFTRRANGNFVFLDAGFGLFEVAPDGTVVHALPPTSSGARTPHHDVIATPNNTLLFLAQEPQADTLHALVGDAIWEWNPEDGTVVKRWNAFDFFDPALDFTSRSLPYDWFHANSLAMGDHGNVIISLNWLNTVVSIAPDFKSLEWMAGGRRSNFVLDADAVFQGQHTAAVLPNGHLLMFDNGRDRTGAAQFSRGLELALDKTTGRAQTAWSFAPSPRIYAPYVGAARRLSNGSTFVFFGLSAGPSGATGPVTGYEVRPDGTVAWQVTLGNVQSVYRATPITSIAGETAVP